MCWYVKISTRLRFFFGNKTLSTVNIGLVYNFNKIYRFSNVLLIVVEIILRFVVYEVMMMYVVIRVVAFSINYRNSFAMCFFLRCLYKCVIVVFMFLVFLNMFCIENNLCLCVIFYR